MQQRQFQLVSEWRLEAPLERVWDALRAVEHWPRWWPSVRRVDVVSSGDERGVGAVQRFTWRTALPYDLVIVLTTLDVQPMQTIVGQAAGELEGLGIWTLRHRDGFTTVRYDWQVDVTKPWMRRTLTPLRRVFAWNHGVVMRRGEQGLRRHLGLMPR